MNPNKYFEFEYNGELYVVPREWIDEHNKQIRAEVIEKLNNFCFGLKASQGNMCRVDVIEKKLKIMKEESEENEH